MTKQFEQWKDELEFRAAQYATSANWSLLVLGATIALLVWKWQSTG